MPSRSTPAPTPDDAVRRVLADWPAVERVIDDVINDQQGGAAWVAIIHFRQRVKDAIKAYMDAQPAGEAVDSVSRPGYRELFENIERHMTLDAAGKCPNAGGPR